ncbi:kelch-like protein 5 isoform X4 [Bemisia tabaci]
MQRLHSHVHRETQVLFDIQRVSQKYQSLPFLAMLSPSQESVGSSSEESGIYVGTAPSTSYSDQSLSSIVSHDEHNDCKKHAVFSLSRMEAYFLSGQLTDVILTAGGRQIAAHKLVLSAGSEYFAAMFTSDLCEARQNEITLQNIDGEALWHLVHYCYTGHIELQEESVETLLSTASLLQLNSVVETCCRFLTKQLHPSNCIGICVFADNQGCASLQAAARAYIEAVMIWISHDKINRKEGAARLLELVRLPLISPSFIADLIEPETVFRDDKYCQDLIMEAMKYHLLPERRQLLQSQRTRPRKSTVGVLYAVGGMEVTKVGATNIEQYNLRTDNWSFVCHMGGRRLQFGVAVLDDKLFVVGGRDGLKTLNSVECFNIKTQSWTSMPPMSTHRHGLGVGVLEGPLYAVGGHDGWSYLNTVERWDPQVKSWSYVASMCTPRSTVGVAVLNHKLYAVGGRDGSSCLKSVECYNPHTNRWTLCASMAKRRGGVGVGVMNGFLYALGGHDAPASNPSSARFDCVERYDPKTDTWTTIASLSIGRDAIGVSLLGDRLLAVGGYDGQSYLRLVESYNSQTNEWQAVAPLNSGRGGACVVVIKPPF